MPKVAATEEQAKAGVAIATNQLTTIEVATASLEVLIGGPYAGHPYGHAALRVVSSDGERVYDFGRYGRTYGDFSAEGDGILRVWTDFNAYIREENSTGRTTTGFLYDVSSEQGKKVNSHYDQLIAGSKLLSGGKGGKMKEYKTAKNYHGITYNCTTMTLAGATLVLPKLMHQPERYNEGRGLGAKEKVGARLSNFGSWPSNIFMPADVQAMLQENPSQRPKKVNTYKTEAKKAEAK